MRITQPLVPTVLKSKAPSTHDYKIHKTPIPMCVTTINVQNNDDNNDDNNNDWTDVSMGMQHDHTEQALKPQLELHATCIQSSNSTGSF